jgi:negative regulator of sigma-B (phosphoserine phosphatase)
MRTGASKPALAGMIDWAVAARPLAGEQESGDLYVVEPLPGGVLVAVIDALGHGLEAAVAARRAEAALRSQASASLVTLVEYCHHELRTSRGVVMSVVSIDARSATLTWLGIGNVDGYLIRTDVSLLGRRRDAIVQRGGVVGSQLPSLSPITLDVAPGDTLVLVTDGIAGHFIDQLPHGSPQDMARTILGQYGKTTDDALVLVARYTGRSDDEYPDPAR